MKISSSRTVQRITCILLVRVGFGFEFDNYNSNFVFMSTETEQSEIFDYIREYLKYWELNSSLELFEEEVKKRSNLPLKKSSRTGETKLESVLKCPNNKTKNEQQLQKDNKAQLKKYQEVLQAGRQIFSVSINLLQIIHNIKEGGNKYQSFNQTIENYKIQLGKHHKIIINEGRVEGTELISQSVIKEHKAKLQQHFEEKYIEGIIEILLSLRVNALQIAPELRKTLVEELIRRDIFKITQTDSFDFIMEILNIKNKSLRHAVTSLISVIVSTLRGIEYITNGGNDTAVIDKVIKILKEQDNGNVTQRFCLAILQKCSVKDSVIRVYWENDLITWVLALVRKSLNTKIHMFCLDFATAMLANMVHSRTCQAYLEKKPEVVVLMIDSILKIIKEPPEKIEVSVLMHLLITISYLCRERFKKQLDETHLQRRIAEFVDFYENTNKEEGEAAEMDKRTVLDLCAHMFHGKQEEFDTEDRIREYENQQGELIFECFQDEVN